MALFRRMDRMEIVQLAKAKHWSEALNVCSKSPQQASLLGLVAERGRQWQTGLSIPPSWWRSLAYLRHVRIRNKQADVVTYNSSSSSCARAAPWLMAAKLVEDLGREMLRANASSYNGLMSGAWSQNVEILRRLEVQSVEATSLSYGSFMRCLPEWNLSWQLLREMRARGQQSNVILQTSLVQACEVMERWEEASELLEDASSQSCSNLLTFSTCISAYVKGTQWLRALLLNAQLQERQLQGNKVTYTTAMQACVKGTRWKAAMHWSHWAPRSARGLQSALCNVSSYSDPPSVPEDELVAAMLLEAAAADEVANLEEEQFKL